MHVNESEWKSESESKLEHGMKQEYDVEVGEDTKVDVTTIDSNNLIGKHKVHLSSYILSEYLLQYH